MILALLTALCLAIVAVGGAWIAYAIGEADLEMHGRQ